jgi:hypothetical protein
MIHEREFSAAAEAPPQVSTKEAPRGQTGRRLSLSRALGPALLVAAAVLFVLHFPHLTADFPNHSRWGDWSKYTDEGWYGDAAIRHYVSGHWYFAGDFNPAVALPVWPALELIVFRVTGVSLAAARALTLCVFAVALVVLYRLIERYTRGSSSSFAAPLAVFLLCASPFVYAFERLAILEPLVITLAMLALFTASHLHPLSMRRVQHAPALVRIWLPALLFGLLLPAMVLAKTTAICLFPAIGYMVWARAGYRLRPALWLAVPPVTLGAGLWCVYFFLFVRPHYLADYRYLFSANAYIGDPQPFATTLLNTLADGVWMGKALYLSFFAFLVLAIFWRPRLFANPLFPAFLLWIGGYAAFLIYHNNPQPRYYLVLAFPITAMVALGLDAFCRHASASETDPPGRASGGWPHTIATAVVMLAVLAIAVPDIVLELQFVRHPTYQFEAAAQAVKRIIQANKAHSDLVLSISGSDLTLMTGLPSIDDDFGTLALGDRVKRYRPGWFITWNEVDDDKADALTSFYSLHRVAAFPALDDPDRNLLILYRLDANTSTSGPHPPHRKRHTPKPLLTRMGQQPSVNQLEH